MPKRDPWDTLRKQWVHAREEPTADASVAETVYQVLRGAIVESRLPVGLKLSEQVVADTLEISRTPVREALLRLTSDRFLARDSRGSPRIQGLTRKRISDIYAVRRVLEGLSARLAAQYSDDEIVAELTDINDALREATSKSDYRRAAQLNIRFHEAIARGSHNDELLELIRDTYGWVRRMPSTTLSHPDRATVPEEHASIIHHINNRDPDAAEHATQEHIVGSLRVRLAMLFSSSD